VSPGNNRWAFKPEIGVVKGIGEKAYLDLILGGEFYSDNDEYMGNSKLETGPHPAGGSALEL